jgi:hypothetical protein
MPDRTSAGDMRHKRGNVSFDTMTILLTILGVIVGVVVLAA